MQARNVVVIGVLVGLAVITGLWIGTQWGESEPFIQTEYVGLQSEQLLLARLEAMEETLDRLSDQMENVTAESDHLDQVYLGLEAVLIDFQDMTDAVSTNTAMDVETWTALWEDQQGAQRTTLLLAVEELIQEALTNIEQPVATAELDLDQYLEELRSLLQEELSAWSPEPERFNGDPIVSAVETAVRDQMALLTEREPMVAETVDEERLLENIGVLIDERVPAAVNEERLLENISALIDERLAVAPAVSSEAETLAAVREEWSEWAASWNWDTLITDAVLQALAEYQATVGTEAVGTQAALDVDELLVSIRTAVREEWQGLGLEERVLAQVEESIQQEVALWPVGTAVETTPPTIVEAGDPTDFEPEATVEATQEVIVLAETDIIRITDEHYVIRVLPGDNIWNLMRRIYGMVTYAGIDEILALNDLADARHLRAGANLLMPRVLRQSPN